ncbi:unnamed protein product [Danaus chrysippus]|uniref:(African queen) hypothetical protein n=1 Tax=Danaus chrysippus TaxID=151541 RepID=A0A8J2W9H9_9NEOP|nr:unnamed protein product [Danaus chrysippus]
MQRLVEGSGVSGGGSGEGGGGQLQRFCPGISLWSQLRFIERATIVEKVVFLVCRLAEVFRCTVCDVCVGAALVGRAMPRERAAAAHSLLIALCFISYGQLNYLISYKSHNQDRLLSYELAGSLTVHSVMTLRISSIGPNPFISSPSMCIADKLAEGCHIKHYDRLF